MYFDKYSKLYLCQNTSRKVLIYEDSSEYFDGVILFPKFLSVDVYLLGFNSRDPGSIYGRDISRDIFEKSRDFPVWFFIN